MHAQTSHSHLATQPELERHTASLHDLAALSTAIVSNEQLITDIAMSETALEANTGTVFEYSDYDIDMSGVVVEADTTRTNSISNPPCCSVDLSWAFDTPLQELLNGHPNDQHGFPLRALAEGLEELANDKGIAISDHTLFQVLQDLEDSIEIYQKLGFGRSWKWKWKWNFKVTKMVIGSSGVLIRVAGRRDFMTERDHETYRGEDRLTLRLRTKSGRASPLDRDLTFAVCSGCADEEFDTTYREELEKLLDSGETTVSCIISSFEARASTPLVVV